MKQVYGDIAYLQEQHSAGLISLQVTPREWLAQDPVIDYDTGKVLQAIQLAAGKFWLSMQLVPAGYTFEETPKTAKGGDYYEISAGGLLNTFNYEFQQVLETIKRSELVCVITDRNKRRKLIGDTQTGMRLSVSHTHKNNPGEEKIMLDLNYQCEDLPPYYNPDNTPDGIGNFLINSNGNFLLIG